MDKCPKILKAKILKNRSCGFLCVPPSVARMSVSVSQCAVLWSADGGGDKIEKFSLICSE